MNLNDTFAAVQAAGRHLALLPANQLERTKRIKSLA